MWPLVFMILAGYGGLVAYVYFSQDKLLYFPNMPSRALIATPAQVGLSYEPVKMISEDNLALHGWFVPADSARGVLLFFHGNAGNISHRLDSLAIFNRLGLSVLIFDYRGYGQSDGEPSEQGTYRDAEAAWRYLTEQRGVTAGDMVFFGRSLGGAIAAYLATKHTPRALILESTFTSAPDLAAQLYPFLPVRWLSRFRYDARAYLGDVRAPVLIIHSRDDEIIPFRHGRELFAAAREPKQFLEISGSHNQGFLLSGKRYREGLKKFLLSP